MARRSHAEALREAAIGYAHQGIPILPDMLSDQLSAHPAGELAEVPVCTCRRRDCPALPLHPPRRVGWTSRPRQAAEVGRWWTVTPDAAIATITGVAFDVIELHTATPPDLILESLSSLYATPGPVLDAGLGRLQLLAAAASYQADRYDGATAAILYLAPGSLVMLPPSRLDDGQSVSWLRPLDSSGELPDGKDLFWALVELPAIQQLVDPDLYTFPTAHEQSRQAG